jgi:hypothetical protein
VQSIVNEQVKECQRLNEVNKENCPTLNPMNKRSKLLSKKSRCTSKQLNAYLVEKHEVDEKKKKAYEWAVKEVVKKMSRLQQKQQEGQPSFLISKF